MTCLTPIRRRLRVTQGSLSTRAFTLVEVVMSVAIVAFSLIVIVGMIPVGLKTMSDTQNDQAIGTIENQLRGDLEQIPFTTNSAGSTAGTLAGLPSTVNYYTTEGLLTDSTGIDGPPYYQAQFAVNGAGVNGNSFSTNSFTGGPANAATVTVTLGYPYISGSPTQAHSVVFSLIAARQSGP